MTTTLVIPDAHAHPEFSNERFTALGNFIVARQPDNIVQIGDFLDLDSICFQERSKPLLKEGKRLVDDIEAGRDAYERLMRPLRSLWKKQRRDKKALYKPGLYWCNGNHEDRAWRYVEEIPELAGFIPTNDFVGCQDDGWVMVPYGDACYIEGTMFTHVPVNHVGRRVGGIYAVRRAAENSHNTVVFGHTHRREILSLNRASDEDPKGRRVDGITVGCYFDYDPAYVRREGAVPTLNWWSGLVLFHHTGYSRVDPEFISVERVKAEYL